MDDLISRQNAIRWVKTNCNPYGKPTLDYDSGIKVINHLEKMQSAQQWIPCSERLPDSQEDVLCDEDGRVTLGYYTDEEIGWHDMHSYRIYPTAWMPLPEPYKGESE